MDDLRGAVSVITGGAAGIGLGVARRLAAEGARLVLADIDEGALEGAVTVVAADGGEVLGVRCDVGRPEEVEALAQAALGRYGKVDIVMANAGVIAWNPVSALSLREWRWVLDVNLWGVIHCAQVFLPIIKAQGTPGHFLTSASVGGILADTPFMATYSATKAAAIGLSLTLAGELRMEGVPIGVSIVCPANTRDTGAHLAERNRPEDAPPLVRAPGVSDLLDAVSASLDAGQPVEELAGRVVEAIRADQLWVFPHPGAQSMVQPRLDALAEVLAASAKQSPGA